MVEKSSFFFEKLSYLIFCKIFYLQATCSRKYSAIFQCMFSFVSDYWASSYIVFSSVWWHPALFTNQFMMICTMYSRITVGKKGKNSGIILICKCIDVVCMYVCHRSPFSSFTVSVPDLFEYFIFKNMTLASTWWQAIWFSLYIKLFWWFYLTLQDSVVYRNRYIAREEGQTMTINNNRLYYTHWWNYCLESVWKKVHFKPT